MTQDHSTEAREEANKQSAETLTGETSETRSETAAFSAPIVTDAREMKNCPFCGGNDLDIAGCDEREWNVCRNCGCDGPIASSESERVDLWNARVSIPDPAAEVREGEVERLLERLETMYSHRGNGIPTQFVNPDGPEAATVITALQAQMDALRNGFNTADIIACAAIEKGFYVGEGLLEKLAAARSLLNEGER